jgi:hypothetical protein
MMLLATILDITLFDAYVVPTLLALGLAGLVVLLLTSNVGSPTLRAIGATFLALACGVLATIGLRPVVVSADRESMDVPGEYLYLDSDRVDAYLGQISNGLSGSEKRSATETLKREATGGASDVITLGATAEQTATTEATVTPTATDRFYTLLGRLRREFKDDLSTVDPTKPFDEFKETVSPVEEGDFIQIDNGRLVVPTYALPLPKIQFAARTRITRKVKKRPVPQRRVTRRALTRLISRHPHQINRYLAPLGADPRIPAVVFAQRLSDPKHPFTFFVPLSYAQITDAPALLSGSITIVGKVIRKLEEPPAEGSDASEDNDVEDFRDPVYYDVEAASQFTAALKRSTRTIRYTLHLPRGKVRPEGLIDPSVTVKPPGMVVLPIAIYK